MPEKQTRYIQNIQYQIYEKVQNVKEPQCQRQKITKYLDVRYHLTIQVEKPIWKTIHNHFNRSIDRFRYIHLLLIKHDDDGMTKNTKNNKSPWLHSDVVSDLTVPSCILCLVWVASTEINPMLSPLWATLLRHYDVNGCLSHHQIHQLDSKKCYPLLCPNLADVEVFVSQIPLLC